jgi:hypothetical protein
MLRAMAAGEDMSAARIARELALLGRPVQQDGEAMNDMFQVETLLREMADAFRDQRLPVLRRLGVINV